MKIIILFFSLIFLISLNGQELVLVVAMEPGKSGEVVYSLLTEKADCTIASTHSKDVVCQPWLSAFPIYGKYVVAEIIEKPNALGIRLLAQDGKPAMLQKIRGKGGLLLTNQAQFSGIWKKKKVEYLETFGCLGLSEKALQILVAHLKVQDVVDVVAEYQPKPGPVWLIGKDFDYWIAQETDERVVVPIQKRFDPGQGIAEVIASEHCYVLSAQFSKTKLEQSPLPEAKPDAQAKPEAKPDTQAKPEAQAKPDTQAKPEAKPDPQSRPIPQPGILKPLRLAKVEAVEIACWHVPQKGAAILLDQIAANTNDPYVFQKELRKSDHHFMPGDFLVWVCVEFYYVAQDLEVPLFAAIQRVQKQHPQNHFELIEVSQWLESDGIPKIQQSMLWSSLILGHLIPEQKQGHLIWKWNPSPSSMPKAIRSCAVIQVDCFQIP